MKIPLRTRKKPAERTAESVIGAWLRQVYNMYPARMMPSTIISALAAAGFVIMSEVDLDAEIALAFQAGEESERDR